MANDRIVENVKLTTRDATIGGELECEAVDDPVAAAHDVRCIKLRGGVIDLLAH